jgi:hypothetical protein
MNRVITKREVYQSPLTHMPHVPKGTIGIVDDEDTSAKLLIVDFGELYGHVLVSYDEVQPW